MLLRKENIVALLSLLAMASALNATIDKTIFYIGSINYLSYGMFQTSQGIIAHSTPNIKEAPMQDLYQLINMKTNNVTEVLTDIVSACGQDAFEFDKLHYHAATATLVYYCLVNNSLLILDEQDWTVQSTIATNIVGNFSQVNIVTDGYSIAILGTGPLFTDTVTPSQLIKVNLQSKQIVNNITFDHDLRSGERVTGYASNGNNLYVLTNTIGDSSNNVTVYSMYLIANSYTLTPLASYNNTKNEVVSLLYCVGDLIVTNSNQTVVIISKQGTILGTVPDVSVKYRLESHLALVADYGSNEFYALLLNNDLMKYTFKNGGYSSEKIGHEIADFQLAYASLTGNSILITSGFSGNFSMIDTTTSHLIYTMANALGGFLTDSAYIVIDDKSSLYFFSRETNLLIQSITDMSDSDYFYDQENQIFSFVNVTEDNQCQIIQINFNTRFITIPLTFPGSGSDFPCPGSLLNVTNNANGAEAVLGGSGSFIIASQTFGFVNFTIPSEDYPTDTLVVDYDTLLVHYFTSTSKSSEIRTYQYDSTTKNFTLQSTTDLSVSNVVEFYLEPEQVLAFSAEGPMDVIRLATLEQKKFVLDGEYTQVAGLDDNSGTTYTLFTAIGGAPIVFYDNDFHTVPGTSDATFQVGVARQCSYWALDQFFNFEVIYFYDICSDMKNEKIFA